MATNLSLASRARKWFAQRFAQASEDGTTRASKTRPLPLVTLRLYLSPQIADKTHHANLRHHSSDSLRDAGL
jgi:hypothetical protein